MDKKHPDYQRTLKLILQELKEDPYRKFNIAFALMSIIPFLVFFYLLATKLFTVNVLMGNIGVILFLAIFISLGGFFIAYGIIRTILDKVIFYAAQAKHSDQLKSTFVASVSHELKSPLTIIKSIIDNLVSGLMGQINEAQKKILGVCEEVIHRMGDLINDLLDLHKIEAGMTDTRRSLCDFRQLIEKQLQEFEIITSKKHINLQKEFKENQDVSFWADEEKMNLVITNLLSNAIKFTPEGGSVTLSLDLSNGHIRFECVDTGQGIPADRLQKIFNKFERLDTTKEGTGLGLSITKDIVEMHKGKIWAESEVGKGSKFIVLLPRDLRGKNR
ncbi:MAG: HAMP domain-containing sensor histidine kinase [Candidatus Omnitrophota bacterium]